MSAVLTFAPSSRAGTVLLGEKEMASLRAAVAAAMSAPPAGRKPRMRIPALAIYVAAFGGGFALAQTLLSLMS